MMSEFFKFPHTPHLFWLGAGEPRGDKVLSAGEADRMLAHELIVEEKVDGANLGISVNDMGEVVFQNRGSYLEKPYRGQFSRLGSWYSLHRHQVLSDITPELVLFGEWCAAKHSLDYDQLDDWFLLFDVYSKVQRSFWDTSRRDELARKVGLATTPRITRGVFTREKLVALLAGCKSRFRDGSVEGLVVRTDDNGLCTSRAKIVSPDFTQQIHEHWSARGLEWNQISSNI